MDKYYTEKDFQDLVKSLSDAVKDFNLVVFIGAGISLSQGYPNWNGYIKKLFHFWQFNIRNFPEAEGKISNRLLSQFDEILDSENTNKRKIDLLHTLLYSVLGEQFNDVKLDFEKYFFKNVTPDSIENIILADLIKLDPIFATSNYDFEIERHLKRSKQKGAFKPINNIREFRNLNKVLQSGDVLHLHGTTDGDWSFFVNSSFDYSRQYLNQPEDFNGLKAWFQEQKPVVLFLGSSMEEEEILSLLPATTKNFALMRANPNETQGFREIYNQTYQKNNNTTIFWYGDSYDDLPLKVNGIVTAVTEKLEIPESIDDWNTLHTVSLNDDEYKEILEKHSGDERFLFDIFKADDFDLEKKILKNTLGSQVLLDNISNISSFWSMLNKSFETLNNIQIESIVKIFQNRNLNVHWEEIFDVFEKLKQISKIKLEELDEIRRNLSQNQELVNTSFSGDADLMGFWLVEQLCQRISYHREIFYENEVFSINLKSHMIPQIIESINDEVRYRYSSFKDIISDDLINIMYKSIFDKKLFLDGTPIIENYPDLLLEPRLFQRILVNIDNERNLDDSILNKLIKKIDFTDTVFGTEMTIFAKNNRSVIEELNIKIPENYHDGIGESEFGVVHPKSFIDNNQILSENVDTILEILLSSEDESFSKREEFFSEKTYQATSDFLLSTLNKNDEVSKKVKKLIYEKGSLFFENYEKLFTAILMSDEYDSELKTKALDTFMERFQLDSFSWEMKNFYRDLINKEEFDNPAIDRLLQVKVNDLNYDYIYLDKTRPELLEINDYINTELGGYLDILIQLSKKDHSRRSEIKSIISRVNATEFEEFTQGAITLVGGSVDIEYISINTFQGYSYSIYGFQREDLEKFKSVGQEILEKGYVNDFNQNNLFILSLYKINPIDGKTEINWSEINFSKLIDITLQSKIEFDFETQWIREIILNDTDGRYGMSILHSLANEQALLNKSEKLVEISKNCIGDYVGEIKIDLLPRFIEKQNNEQKKNLLIELFFLLLHNDKIAKSYFGKRTLEKLMRQLDLGDRKRIVNHPNLSTILSPLEIEELKREIK